MAESLIGSLRVALGLDTAQFEAGANKSKSIARGLSKDIESSFKSAKVAVEGLVAAFAVGALTNQIQQSLQYAAAIGETASTLGVTTKQLQEFRFAAQQTGVSQEVLEAGLKRLTVSIGNAEVGSQKAVKAFNAIGISVADLKGKNTGDVFLKMADALSKVTDRSQRAAVETALMSRNGLLLDSTLSGGSAKLNALADAAQRLGVVLSDEQIRNAEETAHKLEALKTVLEANIASTVTSNANSILSLAQALSTLTNEILHFFSSHPQLALAIIGGLAGSRFGVAGAAAGAGLGAYLGQEVADNAADSNPDLKFRTQQMRAAQKEYFDRLHAQSSIGGLITIRHGSGKGGTVDSARLEFVRQIGLLKDATAAATQPRFTPPGVNLPKFLAPSAPKGRKPPADRSDELLAQMDKEIIQAEQSILQAKQSLAGSNEQHLAISVQLIEIEKTIKDKAIDEEVAKAKRERAEGKITAVALQEAEKKALTLKAEADLEAQVKLRALVEAELAKSEQAQFALSDQRFKFQQDALHTADQLAMTQEDHRRIQLQILDSEFNQKRYELEHEKQLAIRNGATAEQIKVIQAQIDNLPTEKAQQAALINRGTESPLAEFGRQIPQTAAAIKESLENTAVKGLQDFNDQLADAIVNAKSLKDVFHSVAASILQDLIKLALQEAEMALFKAIVGGASQGGLAKPGGFAEGGFVSGSGSSTSDSIPAMLSNGEFVVSAKATKQFFPLLKQINDGAMHFAMGGIAIPRANLGQHVANDDGPMHSPVSLTFNNDFRGVDSSSVARVQAQLDQMKAELPSRVVEAYQDARSRFVIRK